MSDIKSDRVLVCESAMSAAREMVKMAEQGSVVAFAVAVVIDDGDKIFHSYDYDNRAKHSSLELLGVIEVLKAHVLKMTWGDARIIGPEEEEEEPVRPAAVLSLARGASRDACGCCRKCGASVPCVASTNGEGCEGQCFCGTQEDDLSAVRPSSDVFDVQDEPAVLSLTWALHINTVQEFVHVGSTLAGRRVAFVYPDEAGRYWWRTLLKGGVEEGCAESLEAAQRESTRALMAAGGAR